MKEAITLLFPFDKKQLISVYEDKIKIDQFETSIENFYSTILEIIDKYEIKKLSIKGPAKYAKGIGKQIQDAELIKYNKEIIEINYL